MLYRNLETYSKVLKILFFTKFYSRVEIAKILNLTRSSITNITKKLIEQNIIIPVTSTLKFEITKQTVGKKRQYLKINKNFKFVFGATLEKNTLKIAISNLNGEIISKNSFKILPKEKIYKILDILINGFKSLLKQNYLTEKDILAFGFCVEKNIKNIYSEYIKNFFKKKLKTLIYVEELIYGLAISEKLFFSKKYPPMNEKNLLIFMKEELISFFLEKKNIFEKYKIINSNLSRIEFFDDFEEKMYSLNSKYKNILNEQKNKKFENNLKTKNFLKYIYKILYVATMLEKIDNIIIYGNIFCFEDFKKFINNTLPKDISKNIEIIYKNSKMLEEQSFLAGCGISVEAAFLNLEYFKNKFI